MVYQWSRITTHEAVAESKCGQTNLSSSYRLQDTGMPHALLGTQQWYLAAMEAFGRMVKRRQKPCM